MSEETIPQMREQIDSLTKDLQTAQSQVDTLSRDNRRLTARDIAREQGYSAKAGELFANANADAEITAEALDAFVVEYNLGSAVDSSSGDEGAPTDEGNPDEGVPAGSTDLSEMSRGGSRPGDSADGAGVQKMTRQEWMDLAANDKVAAQEAVRQGRVEISGGNPWGDPQRVPSGTNPYAPSE